MVLKEYFEYALFSQAAYALFSEDYSPETVQAALIRRRAGDFAQRQAEAFTDATSGFTVLAHLPNDPVTGFSATVFRSNATGRITIAFRGTDEGLDLTEDGFLAVEGYARDQIYSLYNYVQRLLAPAGASVPQWVRTETFDPAGAQINVTGHSLGGHLAMAASRLFPALVDQVYTYNAPGFRNNATVNDFFTSLGGAAAFPAADITNLYADVGSEIITGLHEVPGTSLAGFIENQGLAIPGNHGIVPLTDALALYALYEELAPGVTAAGMTAIIKAGSSRDNTSLESTLDALRRILLGGDIAATAQGDREQFYQNYYAFKESDEYEALAGNAEFATLVGESAAAIETLAQLLGDDGYAYRYALTALNPFAIFEANYAIHNISGDLERYNTATRTGTLTDAWLEDRADFLYYKIAAGLIDNESLGHPWAEYQGTPFRYYEDRSGGTPYHLYAGANPGVVQVPRSSLSNILLGSDAPDGLTGGNFADRLYGAAGNDFLRGGLGDDYLEGGYGEDIYYYTLGDGFDEILDVDGRGRILYADAEGNQQLLTGGRQLTEGGNLYQSSTEATFQYRRETDGDLTVVIAEWVSTPADRFAHPIATPNPKEAVPCTD